MNPEIGIILPTYNEATNVENLIHEIENLGIKSSILVIDDSSPDGTADIVRNLQKKYDNLLLFIRPGKLGLGTAITDGFKAFSSLRKPPKHIITMDADHSHDPKDILRMISAAGDGNDVVIGSRYVNGGYVLNWGLPRLIMSRLVNLMASVSIRAGVRDYTSGLRCYSMSLVREIAGKLRNGTYGIQIEIVRQAHKRGARIKEVPITFVGRKKGKSKLTYNEVKELLSYILKVWLRLA